MVDFSKWNQFNRIIPKDLIFSSLIVNFALSVKYKCINNYPEHQNNLSDSLYYAPVSKDPRGHEDPQATSEVIYIVV